MDWQELVEGLLDEIARHRDAADRKHVEAARQADDATYHRERSQHSTDANRHMEAADALSHALNACQRLYDDAVREATAA